LIDAIEELEVARGEGQLDLGNGRRLEVSNLDKLFFPKRGYTKGDLLAYYASVSPLILPAITDRPLVMKRFPNGVGGESFYQQRAPDDPPAPVRVEPVADDGLKTQKRLIGGDLATLLYVVQLGAISVDPWHSRVQSVGSADYAIVDLDPGPRASFRRVVDVALWVGEELERLGLHGVPKTSGASGIHIVLPLVAGTPNETARLVAELVATRVAERHPKETTVTRWVQSRPAASVYVDFLQNIRGKTVASVYSARATPDATVSAPLRWTELTPDLDPRAFTIESMTGRIREVGDLWREGMRRSNDPRRLLGDA
jgi:bifunctional non-homologous end joining protein LigD